MRGEVRQSAIYAAGVSGFRQRVPNDEAARDAEARRSMSKKTWAYIAGGPGHERTLIGRPHVYGLAIAGERGVRELLQNLQADFDVTMGLAGCRSVDEIGPETLMRV